MQKVMIVTGASRGIGAAVARLAGRQGYAVCVNYRANRESAQQVVNDIVAQGGRAIAVGADVAIEDEVLRLFKTVDAELGRVDVLVNNAGILDQQMRVRDMQASRISRILATNVVGAFICAREAVRRMSTHEGGARACPRPGGGGGGVIVNVSSASARLGSPGEYVDYAASKGALDTMTTGLAKEVAEEGIRVNGVRPGLIYTEIHASAGEPGRVDRVASKAPMRRGGTVEEVAAAVMWLAGEESSYCTGACIDVAGGL